MSYIHYVVFVKKHDLCRKCDQYSGMKAYPCETCCSNGRIEAICPTCKGAKKFLIIDFIQLKNKQKICNSCNNYYPLDRIAE